MHGEVFKHIKYKLLQHCYSFLTKHQIFGKKLKNEKKKCKCNERFKPTNNLNQNDHEEEETNFF